MITGRSEAVDLFRSWMGDKCPIRVQGSFSDFAFTTSDGLVVAADLNELRIVSPDFGSELIVRLTGDVSFGYADNRVVEGEEKKYGECILIFFGEVPDEGPTNHIALGALKKI